MVQNNQTSKFSAKSLLNWMWFWRVCTQIRTGYITFDIVRAGLHCSLRMSRQILPLLLILGWKTFVRNETCQISKLISRTKKKLAAIVSAILEYSLISYFLKLGVKKPTFHPWFGWIEDWGFLCVEIVRSSCDNDSQNYQQKGGKVTK